MFKSQAATSSVMIPTRQYLKQYMQRFLHLEAYTVLKELQGAKSVLDIGCGDTGWLVSDQGGIRLDNVVTIGYDIHRATIARARAKQQHTQYVLGDATSLVFDTKSIDCVIAMEVIEHLPKEKGYQMISEMERVAIKKIIIQTPNGFFPQNQVDSNPYQKHMSGWSVDDFEALGFNVHGLAGIRGLFEPNGAGKYRSPAMLFGLLSTASRPMVYNLPRIAFRLHCVKELEPKK
jgi:SAM-dependent methyltransferase